MKPHAYLEGEVAERCVICGLPEGNKRHNARPVIRNKRTKREEYA